MMNLWKIHAPLMEEAGTEGGGGEPAKTEPTQTQEPVKTEPAKEEPKTEPVKTEPAKEGPKTEPTQEEPKKEEPKAPLENLLADDPEEPKKKEPAKEEPKAEPTDEERKAFVDAVKKIDIGENVTWDDPLMEKIAPAIMELCDGKAEKSEKLVKLYTAAKQEEARIFHEQRDNQQRALVDECRNELGADLKATCDLAKVGGQYVFGDELWPVMRGVPEFANNVKIIKRLAAIGRTVKDDPGVIKKETAAGKAKRDWRESMYGGKK